MIDLDPLPLLAFLELTRPLAVRTIAFDIPTFDLLKGFQRRLEAHVRHNLGNSEVLKYLLHTHPETAQPEGSANGGC